MLRRFLIVLFIITFPFFSSAKKLDSLAHTNHKEFYFNWDNDIFVFKDFYYTQGAKLFYVNPKLKKNPANHILPRLNIADNYYGIGIIQEIYTPKDVADTLLNLVDRPYAGTLFFRSFSVSSNPKKKLKLTSQLDLGFLGPLSGAKQAQQIIHDWLDLGFPEGWDFQIDNRPYINYNTTIEKGIINTPGFDLIANSRLRVGNIHDDLRAGITFRVGRINNYFKGLNLANKSYTDNRDFQFYIYGGANLSAVVYNATLMGGVIPPESNHQFKFKDIEHFIGEINSGVHISYKGLGVNGQIKWKTREFEGGEEHGWGTISMYFRF